MSLQGDLSEFSLADVIQLVDLSKKTGGVFLQGQRGHELVEGWLYFRDGRIVGAELGDLPPLEAVYTFFTLASGPFRFHDQPPLKTPTITRSNEMLIMEGVLRQEAWLKLQAHFPSLSAVPRLVPNPAATGSEINLEAEEWRILTMINGKNTVAQIAQRSSLGEVQTCEIVARLLISGLIELRDLNLAETFFPEVERVVTQAFGLSGMEILDEAYQANNIRPPAAATREQVVAAISHFEDAALRLFGPERVRQPLAALRSYTQQLFGSA